MALAPVSEVNKKCERSEGFGIHCTGCRGARERSAPRPSPHKPTKKAPEWEPFLWTILAIIIIYFVIHALRGTDASDRMTRNQRSVLILTILALLVLGIYIVQFATDATQIGCG